MNVSSQPIYFYFYFWHNNKVLYTYQRRPQGSAGENPLPIVENLKMFSFH